MHPPQWKQQSCFQLALVGFASLLSLLLIASVTLDGGEVRRQQLARLFLQTFCKARASQGSHPLNSVLASFLGAF